MRAYRPPQRLPYPTVPTAVAKLPINLQRTALYPGRPGVVGEAIEAWQAYMGGQPQPTRLPQRMAFQQWKTGPNQRRKNWLSSAESLMALSGQYYAKSGVPNRVARVLQANHHHPPYQPMYQAGLDHGGARMPEFGSAGPVLLRALSYRPTVEVLDGASNIAAPFPRPDRFIDAYETRAARAVYDKVQRRNAAERGVRLAIQTVPGMQRPR